MHFFSLFKRSPSELKQENSRFLHHSDFHCLTSCPWTSLKYQIRAVQPLTAQEVFGAFLGWDTWWQKKGWTKNLIMLLKTERTHSQSNTSLKSTFKITLVANTLLCSKYFSKLSEQQSKAHLYLHALKTYPSHYQLFSLSRHTSTLQNHQ